MMHRQRKKLKKQLEEYLDWVQESFGTIVLRGIERGGEQVVNIPLETIYVPLQAEIQVLDNEDDTEKIKSTEISEMMIREKMASKRINLNEILSFGNRLIITGGPGSGKTTVLLHLAWALAASLRGSSKIAKQRLGLKGALPLPIYVPLTRYADYLRKLPASATAEQTSLRTYILEYLNERGANFEMLPPDFLNSLLRDGKTVLLLLDGLDEVPNEDERILIRSRIEDLVSGRKNLRVAVTSRSAAYKGQAVLGRDFQHIHVLPLDDEQIAKLVKQAYHAIYPKSEAKAKVQASDLLANIDQLESERRARLGDNVEALVDSPIMIRMLLIVHYNDRKLPDQRADLYQKTVDVILRPDNAPDQRVTDEIEKRIGGSLAMNREMLQHLAFHMHKQGDEQGREIEEDALREILEAESIYKPYVNDLISQTRQRGTLLEERGGLYRFIHLSFQEFLVGRYLVQNFPDPEQLVLFLEDGLCADPWWREPILLAIGYQDINAPIQARRILTRLAGLDENANQRENNYSFDLTLASCELATIAYLESRNQAADFGEQLKNRLKELHQQSQSKTWTPTLLASAMDGLDRLGYAPEDLHHFIQLPDSHIFISKYPVTNAQYERFLQP
ncbi:MAG: signal transduction protein [Chloroflexi bacterium OLB14]|nr:MAG: signal transduction protein [Chloroflexi bacterium OLB14]